MKNFSPSPSVKTQNTRPRINIRRPDVMKRVEQEVQNHYYSPLVEKIKQNDYTLTVDNTTILLAEQFGFCYGVERAVNLAYASRDVFPEQNIFLIGEIIHNPEVNRQLDHKGIQRLEWKAVTTEYDQLTDEDIVIVPAFGAPTATMEKLRTQNCTIIDTTCGDVMSVWKRVQKYAQNGITSIIHGKAGHEETQATASRALGKNGKGHYLIILTLEDTNYVCDYICNGGNKKEFLERFKNGYSAGFDPEIHLQQIGVANQTTMLKLETEKIQNLLRQAILKRDGEEQGAKSFHFFDTICGATQERQDALYELLKNPPDVLLVVGGYNSSNTTHLVEIAQEKIPTFFIRDAGCLQNLETILHYDLKQKKETPSNHKNLLNTPHLTLGITAGASCPNNLIEQAIQRIIELRAPAAIINGI